MMPMVLRNKGCFSLACALGLILGSGAASAFETNDLATAVASGNYGLATQLLQAGVSPQDYAAKGYSTLVVAIRHERDDMVRLLLEYQADPNEQEDGVFAPALAAGMGRGAVLDLLIARGADVNQCDADGRSPLAWAIRGTPLVADSRDVIQRLIPLTRDYRMPLCEAAAGGKIWVMERLLAAGASLETPPPRTDRTALMSAAAHGRVAALKWLLAKGARAQAKDRYGKTALILAAMGSDRPGNPSGATAAGPASDPSTVSYPDCAAALLEGGAHVNEGDVSENTPLMWAAMYSQTHMIRILLHYGATINARSRSGETALIWAARKGHDDAVQHLLAAGADCNLQNHNRFSALSTAIFHQHDRVAGILLAAGADVNSKGFKGVTPLMLAVIKNHVPSVELLLAAQADLTLTNDAGFTVLDLPKVVAVKPTLLSLLRHPETLATNLHMNTDR